MLYPALLTVAAITILFLGAGLYLACLAISLAEIDDEGAYEPPYGDWPHVPRRGSVDPFLNAPVHSASNSPREQHDHVV